MNLRPRFLLLTAVFFIVIALPSWFAVRSIAEHIVAQWAVRHAEIQVRYDKERTLQPILREVALSRQLANSLALRRWAAHPEDPELERLALAEMESFRLNFQDQSYFVALLKNGAYFHNNASNEFAGREFRYTLQPGAAKDAWFFDLIRQKRDLHINVNPDLDLGITKLWIDVLIRDGNTILGMAGTGLDLTRFINDVVEEHVSGVTSLFVDHAGAIQIHRNQQWIDFGSVSKTGGQRKTLQLLFDRPEDLTAVMAAMKSLESQEQSVTTHFVEIKGRRHLAGIAYLPEIDWYEITLMDLDVLLPFSQFTGLLVFYALILVGLLLLFHLALRHYVLVPLDTLNAEMSRVEAGQGTAQELDRIGTGEIRQLMQHFARMAQSVTEARRDLETKVLERTAALETLTQIDPLTELLNRRGMTRRLAEELQRAARESTRLGILWVDVDKFKDINDQHGHAKGDEALLTIGRLITNTVRSYDAVSRWGGDEFLVLIANANQTALDDLGKRMLLEISTCQSLRTEGGEMIPLSVSIGGHLQAAGETLDALLQHGDQALFAAKARSRNLYVSSSELQAQS